MPTACKHALCPEQGRGPVPPFASPAYHYPVQPVQGLVPGSGFSDLDGLASVSATFRYGLCPRPFSSDLAYTCSVAIERAMFSGTDLSGMAFDLIKVIKAFNYLARAPMGALLRWLGLPDSVVQSLVP